MSLVGHLKNWRCPVDFLKDLKEGSAAGKRAKTLVVTFLMCCLLLCLY